MIAPGPTPAAAGLLTQLERAQGLGLLGPGPVADHLAHSLGFVAGLVDVAGEIADLGSGGGVPGLPVAVARPDLHITLIDAGRRRVAFLETAVRELGLEERVAVMEGRAEVLGRGPARGRFEAVLARGFGPPATTAECAAPLLKVGGRLLVSEPPEPDAARWDPEGLALLGLTLGDAQTGPPRIQRLDQSSPCPERFPRRDGVPAQRPLF